VGTFGAASVAILFPSMQRAFVELRQDLAPWEKKPSLYMFNWTKRTVICEGKRPKKNGKLKFHYNNLSISCDVVPLKWCAKYRKAIVWILPKPDGCKMMFYWMRVRTDEPFLAKLGYRIRMILFRIGNFMQISWALWGMASLGYFALENAKQK
jgi:hypothetical protein